MGIWCMKLEQFLIKIEKLKPISQVSCESLNNWELRIPLSNVSWCCLIFYVIYFTNENLEMIKAFLYIDTLTQSQKAKQVQFITSSFDNPLSWNFLCCTLTFNWYMIFHPCSMLKEGEHRCNFHNGKGWFSFDMLEM